MSLLTRRSALSLLSGTAAAALLEPTVLAAKPRRSAAPAHGLSRADDAFLDEMERRALRYFVEQAGAVTGQVLDRAAFFGNAGKRDPRQNASIAATGFGLTALCIGDFRGYLSHAAARAQVLRTLRYHAEELPHEHGFFYHFNDIDTGRPLVWSEVSSIDTALLLCGVLTARAHFGRDAEIVRYATAIYERVDWPWMQQGSDLFRMGWEPASKKQPGFLEATWNHYCELMMIPLLAMGSPTHPVDAAAWTAWSRPVMTYDGMKYISGDDPLFVHQYSHAWFDFRGRRDGYADYFANSVTATRAHKAFCLDMGEPYSAEYWGISASDSATGYQAWGGPPRLGRLDGSVVPCATAGSLPFLPVDCLRVLRSLERTYGERCWNRYGFCDALHPAAGWYDADVLGIDLGIGMVMAENLRSGFVWRTFARNPEVGRAFAMAKLRLNSSRG